MTFGILYWLIAGALITAIVLKRHKDDQTWMAEHLVLAEEEFSKVHLNSSDPRFMLNAASAEVMDDKPEVIANGDLYYKAYALNRIVRNGSGEYFWLRFDSLNDPKVVIKHMEHSHAKALLKDKYIEANMANLSLHSDQQASPST